jgi:NAD(P)-dependent dehydrogenase (short-subunit alcohol dehydrogenase family)
VEQLDGKVALVTGAASGIGLGIARACVTAGMRVVVTDVREEELRAAAAELSGAVPILTLALDVTDRQAWAACVDRIDRELGGVDLLFSNAGVNFVAPAHEATYEDWDFALGVNIGGAVNAIRTVVPRMITADRGGHIVLTSSVSGLFTNGGAGVYVTSKFALVGLAESLRADLKPFRIGVSVLCPGPVKSELYESSAQVRPPRFIATASRPVVPPGTQRSDTAIFRTAPSGEEIGRRVLAGVKANDLYILTHPEIRSVLKARSAALLAALPDEPVDPARIEASSPLLDASLYTSR